MMAGYKTRKKRLRGTTSSVTARRAAPPSPEPVASLPGEGLGERKVYDVWYAPTVKDVYAQFKVAEQMLSRCNDPALAHIKLKVYEVEDLIWQFIQR